ncbi:hypothetical protein M2341_001288 [Sphingobium sp. B7D2B]|nr:hypothetical protein [Sphingobium sp. B7D2B]
MRFAFIANRENVSTTVKIRSFGPVASWSWTKSMAHTSLTRKAAQRPSLSFALTCRLGTFFRSPRPISL